MTPPFFIIHAIGDDPVVEKIKDVHVNRGMAYIVPSKDYTISKTEEQFNDYIKLLEEQNFELRSKLDAIHKILGCDALEKDVEE